MSEYLYGANVHANGIRQHYLRYGGKGPAVVIVPGITSPAVTWGFVIWGDLPGAYVWTGAAIIVASGLYLLHREACLQKMAAETGQAGLS